MQGAHTHAWRTIGALEREKHELLAALQAQRDGQPQQQQQLLQHEPTLSLADRATPSSSSDRGTPQRQTLGASSQPQRGPPGSLASPYSSAPPPPPPPSYSYATASTGSAPLRAGPGPSGAAAAAAASPHRAPPSAADDPAVIVLAEGIQRMARALNLSADHVSAAAAASPAGGRPPPGGAGRR